ncbi:MAG: VTT domain-containing protein [bacterium]|nr:VTT domain-containing protein [bacterium]
MNPVDERSDGPSVTPRPARAVWRELLGPVLVLTALAAAAHLANSRWPDWPARLAALGPWRPAIYVALWLLAVPCGFPAAGLGLTSGFLFGTVGGAAGATGGLLVSGLLMFGLGRRWLRPRVARLTAAQPRLARLEREAAAGGLGLHLVARLSPLNYALTSYTLAAGGAPLRTYAAGLAGALPEALGLRVAGGGCGARGPGKRRTGLPEAGAPHRRRAGPAGAGLRARPAGAPGLATGVAGRRQGSDGRD